jgi:hypothetical protein
MQQEPACHQGHRDPHEAVAQEAALAPPQIQHPRGKTGDHEEHRQAKHVYDEIKPVEANAGRHIDDRRASRNSREAPGRMEYHARQQRESAGRIEGVEPVRPGNV